MEREKELTASVMAPWILPIAVMVPVPTTMHLALPAVTTVPCAGQPTHINIGLNQMQLTGWLVVSQYAGQALLTYVHNLAYST